jgi:6-phosphogluconate dehydrogenase
MKRGLGLNDDELDGVYALWTNGEPNGYLVEITSHMFSKQDEKTGKRLMGEILDVTKQKGTGMWTSQSAMELQVPIRKAVGHQSPSHLLHGHAAKHIRRNPQISRQGRTGAGSRMVANRNRETNRLRFGIRPRLECRSRRQF